MAVTLGDLKGYINSPTADDVFLQSCLDQAEELVTGYVGATPSVPNLILDRATLEVAAEMYHRKNMVSGSSQFTSFDGGPTPVRGPRDPLTMVYPMLNRWMVPF